MDGNVDDGEKGALTCPTPAEDESQLFSPYLIMMVLHTLAFERKCR